MKTELIVKHEMECDAMGIKPSKVQKDVSDSAYAAMLEFMEKVNQEIEDEQQERC